MALETGTHISDLNASNPVSTDGLAQADDHLRLIKSTILASFPNIMGAMTATHTILNGLDGRVSALESVVHASGTSMLFVQSVARTGWTKGYNAQRQGASCRLWHGLIRRLGCVFGGVWQHDAFWFDLQQCLRLHCLSYAYRESDAVPQPHLCCAAAVRLQPNLWNHHRDAAWFWRYEGWM